MPFDQPAHQISQIQSLAAHGPEPTARRAAASFALQAAAVAMGLVASFLVLLSTKGGELESVFCGAGALVVIGLWLGTGAFRRDAAALRVTSALWLVPIAAIQCGWWEIPRTGSALLVEGLCVAMLFAATLSSLGAEFGTDLRRRLSLRGRPSHPAA